MELLVVMTIIVVLASMLLPALQQARGKAKYARWLGIKRSILMGPDLLAYWTFEQASDKVKNIATGVARGAYHKEKYRPRDFDLDIGGSPELQTNRGRFNGKSCLYFDVTEDYLDGGDIDLLEFENGEPFTVSVWFKLNNITGSTELPFVGKFGNDPRSGVSYEGWYMGIANPAYGLRSHMREDGDNPPTTCTDKNVNYKPDNPSGYLRTGWHHVVMVYDGTNLLGYHDGDFISTTSVTTFNPSEDDSFRIAKLVVWSGSWLDGWIGEVAIFDGVLSASEIKQIYQGSRP